MSVCEGPSCAGGERVKGRQTESGWVPVLLICLALGNEKRHLMNWPSASKTYEKTAATCRHETVGMETLPAETMESPWRKGLGWRFLLEHMPTSAWSLSLVSCSLDLKRGHGDFLLDNTLLLHPVWSVAASQQPLSEMKC